MKSLEVAQCCRCWSASLLCLLRSPLQPCARQTGVMCTDHWTKPSEDFLKMNIDGSCQETSTGAAGACAPVVHVPGSRILHRLIDALHAEMMACLKAIEFAAEVGMGCIITETDAYVLLVALQSNEYDASRHGGEIPLCSIDLF